MLCIRAAGISLSPVLAIVLAIGYCVGCLHLLSFVRKEHQAEGITAIVLLAVGIASACAASFLPGTAASTLQVVTFLSVGIGLALFAQMILLGRTSYPRWFACLTPGALFCLMLPLPLALDIRLHLAFTCAYAASLVSGYATRRTAQ